MALARERLQAAKRRAVNVPPMGTVPASIEPLDFAQARAAEVSLVAAQIREAKENGSVRRVFQTVPRTMRRRAASYNIRRLPTRLRMRAIEQNAAMSGGAQKPPKKPSCRKRRRRPRSLLSEFERRSQAGSCRWLETHLWHAKRAHMVTLWGFRLALKMNEKCLRACLRASRSGSFVHDMSYMHVYSLNDFLAFTCFKPFTSLQNLPHSNSQSNQSVEQCYIPGHGPVIILQCFGDTYVFAHPFLISAASSAFMTPSAPFVNREVPTVDSPGHNVGMLTDSEGDCFSEKIDNSNVCKHGADTESMNGASLAAIPQVSTRVPVKTCSALDTNTETPCFNVTDTGSNNSGIQALKAQVNVCIFSLEGPQTPLVLSHVCGVAADVVSSHSLLELSCIDPRLRAAGESDTFNASEDVAARVHTSGDLCRSVLKANLESGKEILSHARINAIRAQLLLPGGSVAQYFKDAPRMPVVLLKMPESVRWLVVVPKIWAVVLWRSIVGPMGSCGLRKAGVRVHVGGLTEFQYMAAEHNHATYPNDYVGTPGYLAHASVLRATQKIEWEKRPPAKRINYGAFKMLHPFEAMLGFSVSPVALVRIVAKDRGVPHPDSQLFLTLESTDACGYISSGFYSQSLGRGVGFGAVFHQDAAPLPQSIYFSFRGAPRREASMHIYQLNYSE